MKHRIFFVVLCAILLSATLVTAARIVNYNNYSGISVSLEPIGPCGASGDCVFMVTVKGSILSDSGDVLPGEFQFRTNDPVYQAAPFNINQTAATALYRKSRRAWKSALMNENTD